MSHSTISSDYSGGYVYIDWSMVKLNIPPEIFESYFKPKQVIFRPPRTIVKWQDDTITIVKCASNEEFNEEHGLAMAYVRKAFPNRSEWIRILENAYRQESDG